MVRSHELDRSDAWEWWCRLTLRGLAAAFAVTGAGFLFLPDVTVRMLNSAGAWFGDFPPAPPSELRLWLSLAVGYMALVTALAYVAQRDLRRHRDLIALLALGKAVTSLTSLGFYVLWAPAFIYLANFLVDGGIALAAVAIWTVVPALGLPAAFDRASEAGHGHLRAAPVMDALLEAMVPPGGPFPEGARAAALAADVEEFAAGAGSFAPRALRLGLRLFDYSPWFLPPFRMQRFSRLPIDERVALLDAWEGSRVMLRRQAMHGLKMMVVASFYSRPEIEARLGYPHPLDRVPRAKGAS